MVRSIIKTRWNGTTIAKYVVEMGYNEHVYVVYLCFVHKELIKMVFFIVVGTLFGFINKACQCGQLYRN